jgi:hypothetical protein
MCDWKLIKSLLELDVSDWLLTNVVPDHMFEP